MKWWLVVFTICSLAINQNVAAQWNIVDVGTTEGLFSVCFINKDTGFICGTNTLLQSFDGGENWSPAPSVNVYGYQLFAINFPTIKVGYVAGPFIVLKTEDSGITWNNVTPPNAEYLYDIQFLNKDTGVVSGDSKYFKTVDGGQTWQEIFPDIFSGISYEYIQFLTLNTGFLCSADPGGTAILVKSVDEGVNWNLAFPLPFPSPAFFQPYKVFQFFSSGIGYAGIGGGIFKTINAGDAWSTLSFSSSCSNLFFLSVDTGYVAGSDSNLTTAIYKTYDGGNSWMRTSTPYPDSSLYVIEMFFLDKNYGFAVGSNGLFMKTENGGGYLGIEPTKNDLPILFPNPVGDFLSIQRTESSPTEISIMNLLGETVKEKVSAEKIIKIDMRNITRGCYMVKLDGRLLTKFIKQ